jgi:hypothetical protein
MFSDLGHDTLHDVTEYNFVVAVMVTDNGKLPTK